MWLIITLIVVTLWLSLLLLLMMGLLGAVLKEIKAPIKAPDRQHIASLQACLLMMSKYNGNPVGNPEDWMDDISALDGATQRLIEDIQR